jgi:NAD-dependent SIR2 family protein deacetylase
MYEVMPLKSFLRSHNRIVVITGAGVSTGSGIPDYRDEQGAWKHSAPMDYREFVSSHIARCRYWARSAIGWQRFRGAQPNRAHFALARLESLGKISTVITQNVDGLHHRAGSRNVIDLHGVLEKVICIECGSSLRRQEVQDYLLSHNTLPAQTTAKTLPDGDALLKQVDFIQVDIPHCKYCGGILKPDVVFYGENVPRARVESCYQAIDAADAMLIAGSSLMVYSSYRFVRDAHDKQKPIALINQGVTRADDLIDIRLKADCGPVLEMLAENSQLSACQPQA